MDRELFTKTRAAARHLRPGHGGQTARRAFLHRPVHFSFAGAALFVVRSLGKPQGSVFPGAGGAGRSGSPQPAGRVAGGHQRPARGPRGPVLAEAWPAYRVLSVPFLSTCGDVSVDRGFEENTCQFASEKPIVLSSPGRCARLWVRTGLEHRMGDEMNFGYTGPGGKWSQEPSNRSGRTQREQSPQRDHQVSSSVPSPGVADPTRAPRLPRRKCFPAGLPTLPDQPSEPRRGPSPWVSRLALLDFALRTGRMSFLFHAATAQCCPQSEESAGSQRRPWAPGGLPPGAPSCLSENSDTLVRA